MVIKHRPGSKQGSLQELINQVAHDLVLSSLENLPVQRSHSFTGQPLPLLCSSHCKGLCQLEFPILQLMLAVYRHFTVYPSPVLFITSL